MANELTGPLAPGSSLSVAGAGYPAPEPLPPLEDEEGGIPWDRFLAAIKRYKWLVLAVALVGTALSVLASRFVKPEYSVTSTIYIEEPPRAQGPIRAEELLTSVQWVELLRTNAVLDSVVERQALFVSTARARDSMLVRGFALAQRFRPGNYTVERDARTGEFRLLLADGTVASRAASGDSLGRELGFRWVPDAVALQPGAEAVIRVKSPRDASSELLEQMNVVMADNGNFMKVTMIGDDPQRLTTVTNEVTAQFVSLAADLKRAKLRETAKILKEQLEYSAAQLRDAEQALETFRVKTITEPSDIPVASGLVATQPTAIKQYFDEKIRIDSLRREREALAGAMSQFTSGAGSVDAFLSIPSVNRTKELNGALEELAEAEANLRVLRQRVTDEYKPAKELQERITTLRSTTIPSQVAQLSRALDAQAASTEREVTRGSRDLQAIPQRTITEQRLTREMQSADLLYRTLQQRFEEASLAEASALPDVKVLDPAVAPTRPSANNRLRLIGMGMLGSLALALGLAILLDRMDKRVRYPDQVEKDLGLAILGAVPQIRRRGKLAQNPEEAAQVVEAFRTIRLNVTHTLGSAAGPVSLTISSPSPGDGKSLVAANLALSFAESGYKVCLLDGDIRRGELHRSFGVERKPGLLDHLSGNAQFEHIMRSGGHPNLTMIPCGTRFERGPEMLGSEQMAKLMQALQRRFNCVIVDSPPLGAGVDPFVLSTLTHNVMLVVRSGETDRGFATAKLKLFERLPVNVLGAVLNDVVAEGVYRHYAYVYGYTADELSPQKELGAGVAAAS
jgi:capsular exopolysaccharide synthesis family protein